MILILLMLALPAVAGGLCAGAYHEGKSLIFRWVSGQFLLWAGFQVISVPMILRQQSLTRLVWVFAGYAAVLALGGAALEIWRRKKEDPRAFRPERRQGKHRKHRENALLWAVFGALLAFQLAQAVLLVFDDADDAYYVSVASLAESSDAMFQRSPYAEGGMEMDYRHALAPFSIWIAFLARLSGVRTVVVAQVVLPVVLISMAYGIYYLFSRVLFPEQGGQRALFMLFTEILVLFGNYSVYTSETFLIGRSRQGKATLGSIVVPFILFLLLTLFRKLQEKEKIPAPLYVLLGAAGLTGCLCSTLGVLLASMAIGGGGLFAAVCYKRIKVLLPMLVCCVPCGGCALLYLLLK